MNFLEHIKKKSPLLARKPLDMLPYGIMGSDYDYLQPGYHDYLSQNEKDNSRSDFKPFKYHINDMGFRDNYPHPDSQKTAGFFGCSITFGEGSDSTDNFPHVISQHYGLESLNLGAPGASARRVALTFAAACRIWSMRMAVVTLPSWTRAMYIDERWQLKNILLNYASEDKVKENYLKFVNDNHLLFETKEAIENIVVNANLFKIPLVMTSWDSMVVTMIESLTGFRTIQYKLWDPNAAFNTHDYARDNAHPGTNLINNFAHSLKHHIDQNKLLV